MLFAHDFRGEDAGGGIQRVNGRVDPELGDLTAENRGGVEVGEGGCRSGVGKVIGRHINGLDGSDGPAFGGGDALLHDTHLRGKRRLVTYC